MMPTAIRVAIVGCGNISYEHLRYLGQSGRVELVGVCDTSPSAAAFAAHRFGAQNSFTDVSSMLRVATPHVVHVLTPPQTHADVAVMCLESGCHVICEKPAACDAVELDVILECAQRHGLRFMESQNLLFNDQVVKIRSDAAAGDLGEVREVDVMLALDLVDSRFGDMNLTGRGVALPGGAVHDFLPHLAYLFLHFTEQPVESVIGRLRNASGNGRVGFDQMDALVFAGDVRGRMRVACDLEPSSLRLTVRGTKGSRETDLYNPYMRCEGGANIGKRVVIERIDSSVRFARSAFTNLRDKVLDHGTLHGLPVMLDAFYAALQDGRPPPIPESAIRSTALLVDRLVALHEQA